MIKVTCNLSDKDLETLQALASNQDITKTDALRRAIQAHHYLQKEFMAGSEILIKKSDGNMLKMIFRQ